MTKKADSNCEFTLGDDLLWGYREIAQELHRDVRAVEHLVLDGAIPAGKIGGKVVASRRKLREFVEAAVSGSRPAA